MPCPSPQCPGGPGSSPAPDVTDNKNNSGNPVSGIPLKIGAPLSSACDRAKTVGSIPEVINFPGYTTVNGGVVAGTISNGGICNMSAFFTNHDGCYQDANARLASTCA